MSLTKPKFKINDEVTVTDDFFRPVLSVFGWGRKKEMKGKIVSRRPFRSTNYTYRVKGAGIDSFRWYREEEVRLVRARWVVGGESLMGIEMDDGVGGEDGGRTRGGG